jgi:hypothetical protein
MGTVNAKNRWTTIYWRVNNFWHSESHIVTRLANERASFLNMNDINDISFFGTSDCYHRCSIALATSLRIGDNMEVQLWTNSFQKVSLLWNNMTYIQNTHRFRGFKLPFADWLKYSLIEELTYEIDVRFQEKILINDALHLFVSSAF